MKHKIRHKNGGFIEVEGYIRSKAIRIFCTECCGYEYHPKECEIKECALWPFRGRSEKAIRRPETFKSRSKERS